MDLKSRLAGSRFAFVFLWALLTLLPVFDACGQWSGTVVNTGTLASPSNVLVDGTAKLTGGGVVMIGGTYGSIEGDPGQPANSSTLINVDNTIMATGSTGMLGNGYLTSGTGSLALDNQANIIANAGLLYIVPNTSQGVMNSGLIEAENQGSVSFTGTNISGVLTSLANAGGSIIADGEGIAAGANQPNPISGQSVAEFNNMAVTGGTLAAEDAGALEFDGPAVVNSAVIDLTGSGSEVYVSGSGVTFNNTSISGDGVSGGEVITNGGASTARVTFDNVQFFDGAGASFDLGFLQLTGTITNTGVIRTIDSAVTVNGSVTLNGGGTFTGNDASGSHTQIEGNSKDPVGSDVLINAETIAGPIIIGGDNVLTGQQNVNKLYGTMPGRLTFINEGLVTNSNAQETIIEPNATGGLVNSGTIQAMSGSVVAILGSPGKIIPVNNTGGSIVADGTSATGQNYVAFLGSRSNASDVYLYGVNLTGGNIDIKNGGQVYASWVDTFSNLAVTLSGNNSQFYFEPVNVGNSFNNVTFTGDPSSTGEKIEFTNYYGGYGIAFSNVSFLAGLTVDIPQSEFDVSGTLTNTGIINFDDPNNPSGQNADIKISGTTVLNGGGVINLMQTSVPVFKLGGSGDLLINQDNTITGGGVIGGGLINRGTLLASSSDYMIMSPYIVVNSGTQWLPLENDGVFEIRTGGINYIYGNYTQGASGELALEIGGTTAVSNSTLGSPSTYSHLDASGTDSLNGTFQVSLENGFMPQVGNVFQVLNYAAESGQFSNYLGLRLSTNLVLQPSYTANGLILTATAVSPGTSAPLQNVTPGSSVGVTGGHEYSGIVSSSNLATGNGTVATVLDGTASASTSVSISFQQSGGFAVSGGTKLVSDAVDFQGTGSDVFVLQIDYNEASISAAENEQEIFLAWLDPATGTWENAVLGNTGNSVPNQIIGAYDPSADFVLGDYGIDPVDGRVWAVVDHNSEFAAAAAQPASVPEPGEWELGCAGAVIVLLMAGKSKRRRR